ncbi:hypothetical protein GOP47_0007738 [Adiantum capillus-veneris]|uniref:Uncharacterized protein n=1 Tax=Adiantum capillus-veneris TaxID=13818 RepID=A0A9D4V1L8_ADICA|nr:hypothetical protein GOP47_0007738 [Adiantum capillus-veneris]
MIRCLGGSRLQSLQCGSEVRSISAGSFDLPSTQGGSAGYRVYFGCVLDTGCLLSTVSCLCHPVFDRLDTDWLLQSDRVYLEIAVGRTLSSQF